MKSDARGAHVPGGQELLVELDPATREPLYEQIYRTIRDRIVGGALRPGRRLPSTRTLARDLAVSRFTVVTAIERLLAEGYLTTRQGAGTFVATVLPDRTLRAARAASPNRQRRGAGQRPRLAARGVALSQTIITGPRSEDGPRPFHPRRPALDAFPHRIWARLVARQWRQPQPHDLDYGDPAGHRPLREAIASHVNLSRAMQCEAGQVIVTSGAQQAFDILFRVLLDPGEQAWLEEPGYLDVRAALVGAGAVIVPVPVDAQGLDVSAGIARAPGARLAVVSPSHQYPTGVTLSAARRSALLAWARRQGAWIIEDDYDSYFRYRGRPVPALQHLDQQDSDPDDARVIYIGTFSKTMFPSLRLGFCVVPPALVAAVTNARAVASRNAPFVEQAALTAFIGDGHYDRHLRRARLIYQERYDAMQRVFARELDGILALSPSAAGTHVLGWLERRGRRRTVPDAAAVSEAAEKEGLVVFPLSRYCIEAPRRDGLVLGYGAATPRQIAAGAVSLRRAIESTI